MFTAACAAGALRQMLTICNLLRRARVIAHATLKSRSTLAEVAGMLRYFVARRWRVGKVIWQSITPKCFWLVTCGRLRQILAWRQRPQVRYHGIWSQIAKRWIESPKVPNRIKSQIAAMKIESLLVKSNPVRRFNRDLNRIAIGICPSLAKWESRSVGRSSICTSSYTDLIYSSSLR